MHSLWAADLAAAYADERGIHPDRRVLLVLAALFHDLGEPAERNRGPPEGKYSLTYSVLRAPREGHPR